MIRFHTNPNSSTLKLMTGMASLLNHAGTIEPNIYLLPVLGTSHTQARKGIQGRKIDNIRLSLPAQVFHRLLHGCIGNSPLHIN